jgi:hypothetical protein
MTKYDNKTKFGKAHSSFMFEEVGSVFGLNFEFFLLAVFNSISLYLSRRPATSAKRVTNSLLGLGVHSEAIAKLQYGGGQRIIQRMCLPALRQILRCCLG